MTRWFQTAIGPLGLFLFLAGCGRPVPPFGEVEGTVLLDGKPLPKALVQFLPDPERQTKGPSSDALADADGRYNLRCENAGQRLNRTGAVVGWHRVVIHDG